MSKTKTTKVHFTFHPDGLPLSEPMLVGSWNDENEFDGAWSGAAQPMSPAEDGSWVATRPLKARPGQLFWWGVKERGEWLLFTDSAPSFLPWKAPRQRFELGGRHRMGLNPRSGDAFTARLWAPNAKEVTLVCAGRRWPMEADGEYWSVEGKKGWRAILGQPYGFELVTSEGDTVLRCDPYARRRQGPQKGVGDLYLHSNGDRTHRYAQAEDGVHLLRFEVHEAAPNTTVTLRFSDQDKTLTRRQLEQRLSLRATLPEGESWWADHCDAKGRIELSWHEDARAYSVCAGPAEALHGLSYQLEDGEGNSFHDLWDNQLRGLHNWARLGLVSEPIQVTAKPDKEMPSELIIYEMHAGSLLGRGGNLRWSTLEEVADVLPMIRDMGFTAIALMPTNATEGHRDWGYLGTCSLAHQESLAQPGGSAEEAIIDFIQRANSLGLYVFTDVVYNHVGGDHNDWWEFDGRKNPYFEPEDRTVISEDLPALPYYPSHTADAKPQTLQPSVKDTPWGPIPAYERRAVTEFFVDHAMDQFQRLGFDGIRFDFTNFIHNPERGGPYGWALLREINSRVRHFFPRAWTFAEEFPPHPIITTPPASGGAGFHAMWNTEHQHRLIFSHHHPAVVGALAANEPPPLPSLLAHLLNPDGFSSYGHSVTVLSNHDEVGNAKRLASLVENHPRNWDIARLVCWLSLLCPGYPILFQGTEDLARNTFSWGLPSTWDVDSHLLGHELEEHRRLHRQSLEDVLNFRLEHSDLHARSEIKEHFLVKDVLGFRRGDFWIVANCSPKKFKLPDWMRVSPRVALSSEASSYGYLGKHTRGRNVGSYCLKVFRCEDG